MGETGILDRASVSGGTARSVLSHAVVGLVGGLLALARVAVVGDPWRRVWAEDGLFWSQWRHLGVAALWEPYQGYLHIAPRLVLLPGTLLPFSWYPAYCLLASSAVIGLLAAFVYAAARLVLPGAWPWLPALSLALTPALAREGLGSVAYAQWFLIPACLWAFLAPTTGRLRRVAVVIALVTGLSSLVSVVLLPLGLWRRSGLPVAALAAGLAIQLPVALLSTGPNPRSYHVPSNPLIALALRVGGWRGLWLDGTRPAVLLGVLILGALILPMFFAAHRGLSIAILATTTVLVAGSSYAEGFVGGRYVASASMMAAGAVALVLTSRRRTVQVAVVAVMLVGALAAFPVTPVRGERGPVWACDAGYVHSAQQSWWSAPC